MSTTPYEKSVQSLYNLQKFGIKFGLSKTEKLLEALGNPHKGQQYVHIAGTNGKGSVAAFMASVLQASGLKVGLYSSPHLVRFTERFRINNQEIDTKTASLLIDKLTQAFYPEEPPTFFEATTAMAMAYFAAEKTDIAIMETGMGGRLDATNIISPLVSVITNISLEHQFYLGNRIIDIAGEKAGIIKKGIDLVTGVTQPSVIDLFERIAEKRETRIYRVGKDMRYRNTSSGLHYYGMTHHQNGLQLGLAGNFQARNAAIALATLERLEKKGIPYSPEAVHHGLKSTTWPGRMQVFQNKPLIVLDGAHNPGAAKALANAIQNTFDYKQLILVIGIMEDKKIDGLLREILPVCDKVIFTRPEYFRAADPLILSQKADKFKKPGQVLNSLALAIKRAKTICSQEDMILITGSLFTVGEALTILDPKTYGLGI